MSEPVVRALMANQVRVWAWPFARILLINTSVKFGLKVKRGREAPSILPCRLAFNPIPAITSTNSHQRSAWKSTLLLFWSGFATDPDYCLSPNIPIKTDSILCITSVVPLSDIIRISFEYYTNIIRMDTNNIRIIYELVSNYIRIITDNSTTEVIITFL